ncbi:MAG: hypothetical protein ROO76_09750 [Terriglobia bacterium]|jgi:hypothetical protein|nr:hypothetical protein [Terriglobia bacterium]
MRKFAYLAAIALLTTGMAVAQSTSTTDQNSNSSTTTQQPATNPDSNAATQSNTGATDQTGAAANTGTQTKAHHGKKLPQTASPLPLLIVLGAGMLGLGGVEKLRRYQRT